MRARTLRAAAPATVNPEVEGLEIALLIEAIARAQGIDFREYAPEPLRERILACRKHEAAATVAGLIERTLHDPASMDRVIEALLETRSGFFRQPHSYRALRELALPVLRTYPYVRIWLAGSGTGQEVYSLAIVLHEEGLLDRSRIYATDLSSRALEVARAGHYTRSEIAEAEGGYQRAGGLAVLGDYLDGGPGGATFKEFLRRHVTFAQHNLATDQSFNEFNLIFCRDVLPAFGWTLQERVHRLIEASLARFGVLVLGPEDSLEASPGASSFDALDGAARLYRRAR